MEDGLARVGARDRRVWDEDSLAALERIGVRVTQWVGSKPILHWFGRESKVNVDPKILKCVAFVGCENDLGEAVWKGTCFFLSTPFQGVSGMLHGYITTARHVIEGIAKRSGEALIRVNLHDGSAQTLRVPISEWLTHPTEASVDVSVCKRHIAAPLDHYTWPIEESVGPGIAGGPYSRLYLNELDIGTDVFAVGLFIPRTGEVYNIPIVRCGNIAAMPTEKLVAMVDGQLKPMEAYLVETRSIGGLSGSPVYAYFGPSMRGGGQRMGGQRFFLMGLIQGHYDVSGDTVDVMDIEELNREKINMGIAIVTPIKKVAETLAQEAFAKMERAEEAEYLRQNAPVEDTKASEETKGT